MVSWDEQTDVLIVGSGAAGLSAAIEARQAGARVLVIEKMKVTGGNTRISDGGLAAPGNHIQRKQGVQDSTELFYQDILSAGLHLNHPRLARVLAEQAQSAIDWTIDFLGVKYLDRLDRFGGHTSARCITTENHTGADLIKAMQGKLDQLGGSIRTRCLMARLITDSNGCVQGAQIRDGYQFGRDISGVSKNIRASKAVILATGGFGSDVAFRALQNPSLDDTIGTTNHRGATAEGLMAALHVKAAPVHLSWIQMGPWGCADEAGYGKGASFAAYSVYPAGILVDPVTGRRIANEWADRRVRSDAIIKTGHACVGVVDAEGAQLALESLAACLKRGTVKAYKNLSDLCAAYAIPPGQLDDTVEHYNQAVANGGQDEFGKELATAYPVRRPPYYAVRLWPKVHYTPGGVGISTEAQAIDLYANPIPRLYAAGEVSGGIHGAVRLGSCALSECIVFGRIAGRQAAQEVAL